MVRVLAIASLSACALSLGDSLSGAAIGCQEIQAQLLGDMPLPVASKIIPSESVIIGRGDNWIGREVLSGVQFPIDIYTFF